MPVRMIACAALLSSSIALADPLPLDEIIQRAQKMMAERETPLVCNMTMETELRGKGGKLEDTEKREAVLTAVGEKQDVRTTKIWKNGQELSPEKLAAEQKEERKNKDKQDAFTVNLAPLDHRNYPSQSFSLLRMDTLWGHPVYVIKVEAKKPGRDIATGTLWIDADHFYEIKGELYPVKKPRFTDWMRMQEQYTLDDKGQVTPTAIYVSGAAGFMFVHKTFNVAMHMSACH